MTVETREDQQRFIKLLSFYLVSFFLSSLTDQYEAAYHFPAVDDLKKFTGPK